MATDNKNQIEDLKPRRVMVCIPSDLVGEFNSLKLSVPLKEFVKSTLWFALENKKKVMSRDGKC